MHSVSVNASKQYTVIIDNGALKKAGEMINAVVGGKKVCIVTDDIVNSLYANCLFSSLESSGYECFKYVFPNGEASKCAEVYLDLLNFLAKNELTRNDVVVALGGGVVGDLAGFAAATFKRGVKLVQIPTTLLAAVDSSVGGKTAIDLPTGKNLVGCFYQPDLVICDPDTLKTLKPDTFSDGCAEVIKYAMIADDDIFEALEKGIEDKLEAVISKCVLIKARIVEQDECDTSIRQILNFGHTIGHAVELGSNFSLSHGKSVAIGMAYIARYAMKEGLLSEADCNRLISLIGKYNLPVSSDIEPSVLSGIIASDKKRSGDTVSFIMPRAIANCEITSVLLSSVTSIVEKGKD